MCKNGGKQKRNDRRFRKIGDCQLLDTKTEGHNESSQRVAHVSLRQPPGFIVG